EAFADGPRGARDGVELDGGIVGVEQAIKLRAARAQAGSQRALADPALLHDLRELPGDHALDGDGFDLVEDTVLLQHAVQRRAAMAVALDPCLCHARLRLCLLMLVRASAISAAGVVRVFFRIPCSTTRRCSRPM